MQDKTSTKFNFSVNLKACQAVGGRLAVDNRRYRLPVRLYFFVFIAELVRVKKGGNKLNLV